MSGTLPNEFHKDESEEDEEDDDDDNNGVSVADDDVSLRSECSKASIARGPSTSVQVALRIRPLLPREVIANARECISVTPNEPQVWIAGTHAFTYDFVFNTEACQDNIFESVAMPLVDGILEGYNATILAYGQTGSGKTYTMGTGFDPEVTQRRSTPPATQGLLPRCIQYLFDRMHNATIHTTPPPDFKISIQFTELYNEEVIDLLSESPHSSRPATASRSNVKIHEDASGQIYLVNINTKPVLTSSETLETLKNGALNRTTASTNMNDSSSRSHAIFTINVTQNKVIRDRSGATDIETLHAKFHFVDLAGSERLKRTLATGERAREGIAINSGLLALGNVISALGDKTKKSTHVPYRDSKLTRLLQDSLGGNSRTLMIACVSPNELDFVETLNTMKYANRAKNIKNKVVINQDKSSRTIMLLRDEISRLNDQLVEYKQRGDGECGDVSAENIMLLAEVDSLKFKIKSKQETIDKLTSSVARLQAVVVTDDGTCDLTGMISKYLCEIEDLRAKLYESESECEKLRAKHRQILKGLVSSPREIESNNVQGLIEKARSEICNESKKIEDDESSSDDDEEQDCSNYTELANLTLEINTKQRLIEELENSQLRLESLKCKYEEKLTNLSVKIKGVEEERDAVMGKNTGNNKLREYEVKIKDLQGELKKWTSAKKEHAKLLRNQSNYEGQIVKLKREVEEMKKLKVKLMNQVKNESTRHREMEKLRLREISMLRKDGRKNEVKVRKLESEFKLKDAVLKRKLEEVEMLKRNRNVVIRGSKASSPVKGKQVWSRVQGLLIKDVSSRCSVACLERDMVGLISRRSELKELVVGETDVDAIDSINSNLRLVEEKICVVQEEICCSEGAGNGAVGIFSRAGRVHSVDHADYSYVVEKLYEQSVCSMSEVGLLEGRVNETEEVNRHLQREVETLRDLLHHLYTRKQVSPDDISETPTDLLLESALMPPPPQAPPSAPVLNTTFTKARRRLTATTQELLGGSTESLELLSDVQPPSNITFSRNSRLTQSMRSINNNKQPVARKLTRQDTYAVIDSNVINDTFVVEGTNDNTTNSHKVALIRSVSEIVDQQSGNCSGGGGSTVSRMRGGSGGSERNNAVKSPRMNALLNQTQQLEGHSKPIMCLKSTSGTLVSGSKDATCRVWDLETATQVACYEGHPHNVSCVCHVPDLNLILTGSSCYVRIFDTRSHQVVKTLCSSGLQSPTNQPLIIPPIPSLPQSTTLPRVNDLPNGEKSVHSIQAVRNYFFTSFGERIRIWDLRKLNAIGILAGKHNSSVMCITGTDSGLRGHDWVITGSKDHTIKVYEYEVNCNPDQITTIKNLNPPHYDGIECLLLGERGSLYSGSRDTCIKKWDLGSSRMVSTVTNAHSGWITGLCSVPLVTKCSDNREYVVSASRDGSLKIWDSTKEFWEVGRFENNQSLECVDSNDKFVFFGGGGNNGNNISNQDGLIGVYQMSDVWAKRNATSTLPSTVSTRSRKQYLTDL